MPTFVFTYRTTPGYTRTPESAEAWMAWFNGMGGHLADIGKPAAEAASVGNCGPGTELGGYSRRRPPHCRTVHERGRSHCFPCGRPPEPPR
jgi:hypothetical protein